MLDFGLSVRFEALLFMVPSRDMAAAADLREAMDVSHGRSVLDLTLDDKDCIRNLVGLSCGSERRWWGVMSGVLPGVASRSSVLMRRARSFVAASRIVSAVPGAS